MVGTSPGPDFDLQELLLIVSGLFFLGVLIHSFSAPNGLLELPIVYYNDVNALFFNGNDIFSSNSCGGVLGGFLKPALGGEINAGSNLFDQVIGGLSVLFKTVVNFLWGIFVLLEELLTKCGFSAIRFLLGFAIVAEHLYFLLAFISYADNATRPFRSA